MLRILLFTLSIFSCTAFAERATTILISIDGFRWDYIEKHDAKNIANLAKQGVRATKLWPQYPTKTFPNHLSIVTGLKPINHGIVDNYFCDKKREECYKMGMGKVDSSWISGIPLWNLVKMHGYKSAAYFWPESDARINGMTPDYYYHYSKQADYKNRLNEIHNWLKLPKSEKPLFVASYFSLVDTMGHEYGPDHEKTREAVQFVDGLIGDFVAVLKRDKIKVNLVLVSDHGMASVEPSKAVILEELDIPEDWTIKNSGTRVSLYALGDKVLETETLIQQLRKKANGRYKVLNRERKLQLNGGESSRIGDIILQAKAPIVFMQKGKQGYYGTHGYEVTPDMAAFFVASGPAFKSGVTIEQASNLEVYPTLTHIMGLKPLNELDSRGENLLKLVRQ
ncbi:MULTISPECIES: ectonucleotide pyrophosphatase/phosphodiesterase [Pseudoalteromonas]|uniref:alkaline phosphatase family protein n=1 Tax=Pseudoalteromonas TaxID=53246 RepID=UPI00029B0212|nr:MULTISPECIES: ectonucleotide pyrophosphatase/phosphodiesterase [Pseudoalteromonas]AUJ72025.1 Type I phosphodiesterase / nucleotide pyrophosphatase [Pseudoalteromonas sp. NC201]MBR8843563.1 alkaline phosphatase family protein [Pseudoalteromonas sp. JC3]MCF2826219.1 ectonucleotide pyrophosphatase/phosphodiesterase [Pseudoalteromonas sp. OF5H-5]MCF2832805.1 ectonucleotide pyrophosphatase/phosphodiesterase [Pseudoalteromonas sp. DL2-H6]MCF2925513.1 ectonucleotide pyrophosphatase/phosphodiestera